MSCIWDSSGDYWSTDSDWFGYHCSGTPLFVLYSIVNIIIVFLRRFLNAKVSQKKREMLLTVKRNSSKRWDEVFESFMTLSALSNLIWVADVFFLLKANILQLIVIFFANIISEFILYKFIIGQDIVDHPELFTSVRKPQKTRLLSRISSSLSAFD